MEILILIFGGILLFIVLFIFSALYIATAISKKKSQKHLNDILDSSPYRQDRKKPHVKKTDEFQARDERKEIVTGKEKSQEYIKLQQRENDIEPEEGLVKSPQNKKSVSDDTVVVGVAKPLGFWTRLIMSQSMQSILMRLNLQNSAQKNKHGYYVNLIKAQSRAQGKHKGRSL
jgi:hypothetical protein